ncbi:MAG: TlpA family protein disulfide reductase [Candidatus Omnitrophota bacterium]
MRRLISEYYRYKRALRKVNPMALFICCMALAMTIGCNTNKQDASILEFADKFASIQKDYSQKVHQARSEKDRTAILKSQSAELEKLFNQYDKLITTDEAELFKSKLLVEVSRFTDANRKIDFLIRKKSPFLREAELVKVQILAGSGDIEKASELLKTIEPRLKDKTNETNDLYHASLFLATHSTDPNIIKKYGQKCMKLAGLSKELSQFNSCNTELFRDLAEFAREDNRMDEAKNLLGKAIYSTSQDELKQILQGETLQMELLGKPALPITDAQWMNSDPIVLENIKGNVGVLVFWSSWCDACHEILPILMQEYNAYKDKGLVIIGYTKLYGKARDEKDLKQSPVKDDELALIKKYTDQNGILFPVCVSTEGFGFDDYKVAGIPAIFFIDKNGNVSDFKIGSSHPQSIRDKIRRLMEAPYGKDQAE